MLIPETARAYSTEALDQAVRAYPNTCSVLLKTAEGETLYYYKPATQIFGASLIKLPYAVYACQQLSAGVHSLSDTMTYTEDWFHDGTGIIRKRDCGETYTIRELLDYSLCYSDNVAYDMLVSLFGVNGFNQMVSGWGYSVRIATPSPRFPAVTSTFMYTSMREMYLHRNEGECWSVCWDALLNSTDIKMRPILSDGDAAVKYGWVEERVYHETCFVDGKVPYILTVMTAIRTEEPDTAFMEQIAGCVRNVMDAYISEKYPPQGPGDCDGSGLVDASDAAYVLIAAANLGVGEPSGMTAAQEAAADVDQSSTIDAADALCILGYAAYCGAGGADAFDAFLVIK